MRFQDHNGLRIARFESFPDEVTHGFLTRQGGVSTGHLASLNVGGTVGDDPMHVHENRRRSFDALGRHLHSMFDVWQVHSADAVVARSPRPADKEHEKADIILTQEASVTLYMRFADCVPVLLCDSRRKVIALAHAGWLGTVRGASVAAVNAMSKHFASAPADIIAGIGPSIGPDHYEVGPDVTARVADAFGSDADKLIAVRNGKTYLDLWKANELQLRQLGVARIEVARVCTACNLQDWFSHRAEHGRTGRFGAILALN